MLLYINVRNKQFCVLQLATKEKEIIRLRRMLEGGRSYATVSKDCTCKKLEKKAAVAHDAMDIGEVRVLQQAKLELEQQLKGEDIFFFNVIHRFHSKDI